MDDSVVRAAKINAAVDIITHPCTTSELTALKSSAIAYLTQMFQLTPPPVTTPTGVVAGGS